VFNNYTEAIYIFSRRKALTYSVLSHI